MISFNTMRQRRKLTFPPQLIVQLSHETEIAVTRVFELLCPSFDILQSLLLNRLGGGLRCISLAQLNWVEQFTLSFTKRSRAPVQVREDSSSNSGLPQF